MKASDSPLVAESKRRVRQMRYEQWLNLVDDELFIECGLRTSDLPELPYRKWFQMKASPQDAARWAMESI